MQLLILPDAKSHFSASPAVPQNSRRAPEAQRRLAVTPPPARKTRPRANSSFILEMMTSLCGRDASENFGGNDQYSGDDLCAQNGQNQRFK